MAGIFARIVNGEIPAYKVAETDRFLAFLDVAPLSEGHTLVIPKTEVDYILDLQDEDYNEIWIFAKKLARAIETVIPCKKVGFAVVGLEVPHAHIHLLPLNSMDDIDFKRPKMQLTPQRFQELSQAIQKAYSGLS